MSDSNKKPEVDFRLKNLTNALYLTGDNDVALRTGITGDIIIEGSLLCFFTSLSNLYTESELRNKFNIKGYVYGTKY